MQVRSTQHGAKLVWADVPGPPLHPEGMTVNTLEWCYQDLCMMLSSLRRAQGLLGRDFTCVCVYMYVYTCVLMISAMAICVY